MIQKLTALAKDPFMRNNIILFIGSGLTAVLNYAYHPVLSRMMSIEDFGEVQALISMAMQLGILTNIFTYIAVNIVVNSSGNQKRLKTLHGLHSLALSLNFLIAIGILLAAPFMQSSMPFYALALSLLAGTHLLFYIAYFRGVSDFFNASVISISQAGGKLFFAVIFVLLGWATFGAIFALFCTIVLAIIYSKIRVKGKLRLPLWHKIRFTRELRKELWYGVLVLFATGLVTALYTADVVLVKTAFTPEEAGLYGGIATVARIIFFGTGSVVMVLLSAVKIEATFGQNVRLFIKSLLLILFMGGGVFGVFWLFPEVVINILIGSKYAPFAYLLPWVGLLVLIVSVLNLFINYFLALRRFVLIPIAATSLAVLYGSVQYFGGSIEGTVLAFLVGAVFALVVLTGLLVYDWRSSWNTEQGTGNREG